MLWTTGPRTSTLTPLVFGTFQHIFFIIWRKRHTSFLLANSQPKKKKFKIFTRVYITSIAKTRLYNFDPLKPHFYIVKLGFTRVYIIFLIFAQKHRLWVLVGTASSRRFQRVPTIYVLSRSMKNIRIFCLKIFILRRWKFQYIWIDMFS